MSGLAPALTSPPPVTQHRRDPVAGLREMRRVARRVVVFTHDTSDTGWLRRFWLTRDYLPEVADLGVGRPSLTELARAIGARVEPVLIPWDCADGFFEPTGAGPRRTWTTRYVAECQC